MESVRYGISIGCLCVCAWTDLKNRRIYRWVIIGYLLLSVLALLIEYMAISGQINQENGIWSNGGGGWIINIIPGLICLFLSIVSKQSLGIGDSLLILVLGISVGGWNCFQIILLASIGSFVWSMLLLIRKRGGWKTEIPFAPFLLGGTILEWFL